MNLKTRLMKLESALPKVREPIHISIFVVDPQNIEPAGYRCEGQKILRMVGETTDQLRDRCCSSIAWPEEVPAMKLFDPIEYGKSDPNEYLQG